MSHNLSGICVRAPRPKVVATLQRALAEHGVSMRAVCGGDDPHVNVRAALGWTMLQLEGRLMPRIAVELSSALATRVVCFDVCERYNYEHVADLYKGEATLVV